MRDVVHVSPILERIARAAGMSPAASQAGIVARVRHLVADEVALDHVRARLELEAWADREAIVSSLDRVVAAARWACEQGYEP